MTRPAIIIGVGGAGVWTLTHLKKELQDSHGGKVPASVKLIGFDTILHPSAIAGNANLDPNTAAGGEERNKKVGAVQLEDKIEYQHIGYDLAQTPDSQRTLTGDTGKFKRLGAAGLSCIDGAAQSRKLGRLCTVYDFAQGQNSRIRNKLVQAMGELGQLVGPLAANPAGPAGARPVGLIDIFVVGSMAGGTGSGMLVDMGLICRYLKGLHLANIPITMRAVIYTPRTFLPAPGAEMGGMFAASFAAWRELDRFIVTNQYAGATRVRYSDRLVLSNTEFLYDVSYLVDPARAVNPIPSGRQEDQLYPGVANAIAAMIDDQAGAVYAGEVVNILNTKSGNPNLILHSALGSHVIKSARHYEEKTYSLVLTQKLLEDLLKPVITDGHYRGLDGTQNPQSAPPRVGPRAASDFMIAANTQFNFLDLATKEPQQAVYPNTLWNKLISRAWTESWGGAEFIGKHAAGNLADHQNGYKDVAANPVDGSRAENKMRLNWSRQISAEVKTSMDLKRNPRTPEEKARIPQEIDTKRVEISTQYEMGLREAQPAHQSLFKDRLRAELDNILNGTLRNVVPDKTGRLGFAIEFVKGLNTLVSNYAAYLTALQNQRARDGRLANAIGRENSAKQEYEKNIKDCLVVYWDYGLHPLYRENQRNWFRAADHRLKEELKEKLLTQETLTAATYLEELKKTEENLSTWEQYLAKGKVLPDNKKVKGLYDCVKQELINIGLNFQNDRTHAAVMDILAAVPPIMTDANEIEVMAKLSWQVVNDGQGVTCVLKGEDAPFVNQGAEEADQSNLNLIEKLIEPIAKITMSGSTFGAALRQIAATELALGQNLSRKAEPFYQMTQGGMMYHNPAKTGKLCVNNQDGIYDYDRTIQAQNALEPAVPPIYSLINVNDDGKLTLLRTDDCIMSSDFAVYDMCRSKYEELARNPSEGNQTVDLHVFPAETNACQYEIDISSITGQNYKILHPRVVALMDDIEKFEGFYQAKAVGFIQYGGNFKQNGVSFWGYEYERANKNSQGVQVKSTDYIQLSLPDAGSHDYYQLINQFAVDGKDIRPTNNNTFIDWVNFNNQYNVYLGDNLVNRRRSITAMKEELGQDGMVSHLTNQAAGAANPSDKEVWTDLSNVTLAVYTKLIEKEESIIRSNMVEVIKNMIKDNPSLAEKAILTEISKKYMGVMEEDKLRELINAELKRPKFN